MYQFEINSNEAGQRFDKYLHKLLPLAPASFLYKMLRKKNIVLNEKKAEGKEKLVIGDKVSLFLSEETFHSFQNEQIKSSEYLKAYRELQGITVIYENDHMLLLNKPAGILTQKAKDTDVSVNEWLIGYLLDNKKLSEESMRTYKPSVCNRLDRNTSGLVICARTLTGSQHLNELIRERKVRKFYRLFVKGSVDKEETIEGYLTKDELTNKVSIVSHSSENASYIKTRYYPIMKLSDMTYLEVELITGKPHQIRAHMASIAHPVLMDYKYGDKKFNDKYQSKLKVSGQLLHAYRLEFPRDDLLPEGEEHIFIAREPVAFKKLLQEKNS